LPHIETANAVILGISPDTPETLAKWREKKELPFDLLSDPEHTVLEKLGAWGEKKLYGKVYFGVIRSHFIIDESGKLAAQKIKVSPADSVQQIVEFLAE